MKKIIELIKKLLGAGTMAEKAVELQQLETEVKKEVEVVKAPTNVISIQERMEEKAREHAGEFEGAIDEWVENPYWQFFCGYDFLQWEKPIDSSSLPRWRNRLGVEGIEKILQGTIKAAIKSGAVLASSLCRVIVDTTVMEKNIAFPTDAKLYYNGIRTLVRMAKNSDLQLRQTYTFLSKKACLGTGTPVESLGPRAGTTTTWGESECSVQARSGGVSF